MELNYVQSNFWDEGKFRVLKKQETCQIIGQNICFGCRNLVADVWSVLQENAIKYVSNTMFLPLIVRCLAHFL